jgi:signal transduction histidine kinase
METRDLTTLARLSALVNSSLDIDVVLDNAMRCVEELTDAEASSIFEMDRDKGEIFFRLARGERGAQVKETRLRVGEGVAGWVAATGRPALISSPLDDPRFAKRLDANSGFRTRCILCVPLQCKNRLVGVLQVLNKRGLGGFDERDLELVTLLANQVAIALENAKLHDRLTQQFAFTAEELKTTQQRLIRSERLAALGRLAEGVAHEVRNPVLIIAGFARRLLSRLSPEDPVRKSLRIIIEEAERLEGVVREVENLAGLRQPVLRPVHAIEVLERALSRVSSSFPAHSVRSLCSFAREIPEIMGDEELLELALSHVIRNAFEAMTQGGTLQLSAETQLDDLVISVGDTGAGIPPGALPNVFDPFFTSKPHGSGLGLATAHRVVSDHEGEIQIHSIPGEGTVVRIRLPRRQPL